MRPAASRRATLRARAARGASTSAATATRTARTSSGHGAGYGAGGQRRNGVAVTGDEFRSWALGLPEAVEQETWGHPTFRVRQKMFATLAEDGTTASVKATLLAQAELVASDPETYSPAHYVGRYGWVSVVLASADPEDLRPLVVDAWRRTAPKRLAAQAP